MFYDMVCRAAAATSARSNINDTMSSCCRAIPFLPPSFHFLMPPRHISLDAARRYCLASRRRFALYFAI